MQVSGGSFPPCVAPPVLLPAVGMDRDARCRGRAISHRRMDGLGDDTRTRLTALYNSSTSINPCITCPDDPCIIKDKKQMIKCNVTVCGVIGRDASVRKNKEEKEFLVFPLRVQIPATGGGHTIEVDVRKEGCQEEAAGYRNGSRVEVRGPMKSAMPLRMMRIASRASWCFVVRSARTSRKKGIRKTSLIRCSRRLAQRRSMTASSTSGCASSVSVRSAKRGCSRV